MKFAPKVSAYHHPFFSTVIPSIFEDVIGGNEFAEFVPAVNIAEDEKNWNIEVSAAGFKKEDFKIKLEGEILLVAAEHKEDKETELNENQRKYSRREFRYGSFSRRFTLPKGEVNEDGINATYENGILKLSIPKKIMDEKDTLKEIEIS